MSEKKPVKLGRKSRLSIGRNAKKPIELDRNIVSKMAQQIREKMLANQPKLSVDLDQDNVQTDDKISRTDATSAITTSIARMAKLLRDKMSAASNIDPLSTMSVDSSSVTIPSPVPQTFTTMKVEKPKQVLEVKPITRHTVSVQKFGNTYKPKKIKKEKKVLKRRDILEEIRDRPSDGAMNSKQKKVDLGVQIKVPSSTGTSDSEDEPLLNLNMIEKSSCDLSVKRRTSQRKKIAVTPRDFEKRRGVKRGGNVIKSTEKTISKMAPEMKDKMCTNVIHPNSLPCSDTLVTDLKFGGTKPSISAMAKKLRDKMNASSEPDPVIKSSIDLSTITVPPASSIQKFGNTYQRKKIKSEKFKPSELHDTNINWESSSSLLRSDNADTGTSKSIKRKAITAVSAK